MMPDTERRKLQLPDRRRHTYDELCQRLDDHIDEIEAEIDKHNDEVERRLHRFFSKALAIFAVIGFLTAFSLLGYATTVSHLKQTRKQFVYDQCISQNKRHDLTVKTFFQEAARLKKKFPAETSQINQSIQSNLRLISDLAPKQDCVKLAKVAVGEAEPPPPYPTS